MPQRSINTVIVEPQSLVRDILSSLLVPHSFNIVGTFATIHKFDDVHRTLDDVDLTILSGQSVDQAVATAEVMLAACPGGKVVFLFDELSSEEMRRLCSTPIDGCVSLHVSHDLLMRSIDLVVEDNVRLFTLDETVPRSEPNAPARRSELVIDGTLESGNWSKDRSMRLESAFFHEGNVFRDESGTSSSVIGKGGHRRH
jgi:DNA-binding NarL/FixJ family response regulator